MRIMMKRILLATVAACALAACGQPSENERSFSNDGIVVSGARAAKLSETAAFAPAPATTAAEPQAPSQSGAVAPGGALLAYSYSMGVKAPKPAIAPMVEAHAKTCVDAGPSVCQLLGSSVNVYGEEQVSGYVSLRAEPIWLKSFRGSIESDAGQADGEITQNAVNAEDLTQYITDTQARLDAKLALRERIKALLERREGGLADALAAERALSDVQGEIDSMTASLQQARARVAMSALTISYETDLNRSGGIFSPLGEAFADFGRVSIESIAGIVRFVSRAWPAAVAIIITLGAVRLILPLFWRRRKK